MIFYLVEKNFMEQWVESLYVETHQKWEQANSNESGYAIFYSPVKQDAKIALIGYNPGGIETPDMTDIKVPKQHEYVERKYKLAQKVYKIFESADLIKELENSVKFNLIFFRSRKAIDFNNDELINFSEQKVLEILQKINPKIIITEGFKTFDRLLRLYNGKELDAVYHNNRKIMKVSKINSQTILGMVHPSGARGISDAILQTLGKEIKKHVTEL